MIFDFRPKLEASYGDTRTIIKFAWLPEQLSNSKYVWLEHFEATQSYITYSNGTGIWQTQSTLCPRDPENYD